MNFQHHLFWTYIMTLICLLITAPLFPVCPSAFTPSHLNQWNVSWRHPSLRSSIHPCISMSAFRSFHHCGADACRPRLLGYFQLFHPPLYPFFSSLILEEISVLLPFVKGQPRAGLAGFPLHANIAFGAPSHASCPNQGKWSSTMRAVARP